MKPSIISRNKTSSNSKNKPPNHLQQSLNKSKCPPLNRSQIKNRTNQFTSKQQIIQPHTWLPSPVKIEDSNDFIPFDKSKEINSTGLKSPFQPKQNNQKKITKVTTQSSHNTFGQKKSVHKNIYKLSGKNAGKYSLQQPLKNQTDTSSFEECLLSNHDEFHYPQSQISERKGSKKVKQSPIKNHPYFGFENPRISSQCTDNFSKITPKYQHYQSHQLSQSENQQYPPQYISIQNDIDESQLSQEDYTQQLLQEISIKTQGLKKANEIIKQLEHKNRELLSKLAEQECMISQLQLITQRNNSKSRISKQIQNQRNSIKAKSRKITSQIIHEPDFKIDNQHKNTIKLISKQLWHQHLTQYRQFVNQIETVVQKQKQQFVAEQNLQMLQQYQSQIEQFTSCTPIQSQRYENPSQIIAMYQKIINQYKLYTHKIMSAFCQCLNGSIFKSVESEQSLTEQLPRSDIIPLQLIEIVKKQLSKQYSMKIYAVKQQKTELCKIIDQLIIWINSNIESQNWKQLHSEGGDRGRQKEKVIGHRHKTASFYFHR